MTHPCPQSYVPTVFENYTASFEIDKRRIELNMWDTSGSQVPGVTLTSKAPTLTHPLARPLGSRYAQPIHPILEGRKINFLLKARETEVEFAETHRNLVLREGESPVSDLLSWILPTWESCEEWIYFGTCSLGGRAGFRKGI